MIFFAIVEFGIAFARWQVLSNAAREGARRAVVFRDPDTCSAATVETAVDAAVIAYAASLGMTVAPGDVTVSGACTMGASSVTVTFQHSFLFLPGFAQSVSPQIVLTGTSTMRNEG
jgi:Flp pilus assembly protein TadG